MGAAVHREPRRAGSAAVLHPPRHERLAGPRRAGPLVRRGPAQGLERAGGLRRAAVGAACLRHPPVGPRRLHGPGGRALPRRGPQRVRRSDPGGGRLPGVNDADAVDLALLALRCVVGAVVLAHGINHVVGGGRIPGTARWFESLGMRPGVVHAWLASGTEIVAGVLLVLGLLTPLA